MGNVLETSGNRFLFRQQRYEVLKDTFHDDDGCEYYKLQLRTDAAETYLFAYAPVQGLVMINEETGQSKDNSNVVGAFLSMDISDVDEVIGFIEKYGFFFSLKPDRFVSVSFDDLRHYLSRMKMVIQLCLQLLNPSEGFDYNELFLWTFRLLLGRPKEIDLAPMGKMIKTCVHPITRIWYSAPEENRDILEEDTGLKMYKYPEDDIVVVHLNDYNYTSRTVWDRVPTVLREKLIDSRDPDYQYFEVTDTFSGCIERISMVRYHEIMGDIDLQLGPSTEEKRRFRARLTYLYVMGSFEKQAERESIDFLVHMYDQVSRLEFCDDWDLILPEGPDLNTLPAFHGQFKEVLLKLVKRTVKEELDYVLSEVHPIYDAEKMEADWNIPDLCTAMCFSVFYMKPNQSVFRLCENPNCRNMFEVSTTNRRKKFCSAGCQQSVAKKNWEIRKKMKEQEQKTEENKMKL